MANVSKLSPWDACPLRQMCGCTMELYMYELNQMTSRKQGADGDHIDRARRVSSELGSDV